MEPPGIRSKAASCRLKKSSTQRKAEVAQLRLPGLRPQRSCQPECDPDPQGNRENCVPLTGSPGLGHHTGARRLGSGGVCLAWLHEHTLPSVSPTHPKVPRSTCPQARLPEGLGSLRSPRLTNLSRSSSVSPISSPLSEKQGHV